MDISVTYFKQHCLKIIRRIEKTGATISITRRGRIVAQLRPPRATRHDEGREAVGAAASVGRTLARRAG